MTLFNNIKDPIVVLNTLIGAIKKELELKSVHIDTKDAYFIKSRKTNVTWNSP